MLSIGQASKFKKDRKRCVKRGYDLNEIKAIVTMLANQEALPKRCKPHTLSGQWSDYWECHIKPDWLLIWRYEHDTAIILERTGTHADLFE